MKEKLIEIIKNSLLKLEYNEEEQIIIEEPALSINGDFSTNVALKICKKINVSPMEIAEKIVKNIEDDSIKKIEVKSPGFINFFVNKNYLFDNINLILNEKENYGKKNLGQERKVNLEYVSANPTGILHLGNARGGAYGDNMARILSFENYSVNREYYVNDSGNQIENLGKSIKVRYLNICGIEEEMPEAGYYGEDIKLIAKGLYDKYKDTIKDEDISFFKEYGTQKLLNRIIEDLKEYRVEYDKFTSELEIKSKDYINTILKSYKDLGYSYKKDGALWFNGTKFGSPRDFVLVKEDGNYTYILPDIAHHIDTLQEDYIKLINILGADHHGYVPMITTALEALNYDKNILDIKLLQLVRLIKNGEEYRMSKRTGNVVTLKDLIDEVGVNAVRYFFASRSLDTQMDFNIDIALKESNENPIYYISYAYARICSILSTQKDNYIIEKYETLDNEEAYNLLDKLYSFKEIVEASATKECPHFIANYVYELANMFHIYYSKHRIITDNERATRENLNMIRAVKIVLKTALDLIGIVPPERM